MTQPTPPDDDQAAQPAPPPAIVDADTAAVMHLDRAAMIMDAIASAADESGEELNLAHVEAMFRQAEIHALIGGGYANLTHPRRRPDMHVTTTPPVVYPNG